MSASPADGWTLQHLQRRIAELYGAKDADRGEAATFVWLTAEFGELAEALRTGSDEDLAAEMADVLAWLATLANLRGIDLTKAVAGKYGESCPGCGQSPCVCDRADKP